ADGTPTACGAGPAELATGGPASAAQAPRTAGQDAVVGYLLRRREGAGVDCAVPGVAVELLAREKNSTVVRVVRTATTDAEGRVSFRVTPPRTVSLTARSVATPEVPPAAATATVVVGVRTRVTAAVRRLSGCRVEVAGRTSPAKPGSRVRVDSTAAGRLPDAVVAADGTYRLVRTGRCQGVGSVLASIAETHANEPGSSAAPAAAATSLRTCGTGGAGEGPLEPGLTHRLVVFATDTVVGGSWYGERVLANPTDSPISYDYGRGFVLSEPYRVMRYGTRQVLGLEGRTDFGQGATTRTLQPGQEERVPVVLDAANCYAEAPPSFESRPGPSLPPGRYVGTSELSVDRGRSWTSQRVALTVS
ncbi:MAG: hypothetical protein JWM64_1712, partial [Frankiales bacterium]|nr:hypothetical protein [Frankiales bacterium]